MRIFFFFPFSRGMFGVPILKIPHFPSLCLVICSLLKKKNKISTRICVDHSLDFKIQDQSKTEKPTRFFFRLSFFTHECVKINTRGAGRFSFPLASFAAFFFFWYINSRQMDKLWCFVSECPPEKSAINHILSRERASEREGVRKRV